MTYRKGVKEAEGIPGSSPLSLELRRRRDEVILEWNEGLPIPSDDHQSMG